MLNLLLLPEVLKEKDMIGLKVKFDGETNQIEANTFINSLLHFTNVVHEINREMSPDKKIEIKINANKPGSFIVDLTLASYPILQNVASIFTKDAIGYAADLAQTVAGAYGLYKFLGNGKPKVIESTDNSVKIENNNGDVTYIDRRTFYICEKNILIRENIADEFQTLEADINVTGFEILDKDDKQLVEIPREEFSSIASPEVYSEAPNERYVTKPVVLNIVKLSFEEDKKWEFVWENRKITARMSDESFHEKIDKGEKFAKGDQLEADLEIRQQKDESVNEYLNKSYNVKKIVRHIPRSEPPNLFTPKE